jgi:hypothetical protein
MTRIVLLEPLQPTELDLRTIDPRKGPKFSPNLYRWLTSRKRKHRAWTSRVYRDADGVMWIGMLDLGDLIGCKLYSVLCNGAQENSACWVNLRGLQEVPDFWAHYMRYGRCAIDIEHTMYFLGDDTRWTHDGDTRHCLWCGTMQRAFTRLTEPEERKEWKTVQS